jgi:hypothetical protein
MKLSCVLVLSVTNWLHYTLRELAGVWRVSMMQLWIER